MSVETTELTWKDACNYIAESQCMKKPDGSLPSSKEIWEYSPSGELGHIYEWLLIAVEKKATEGTYDGRWDRVLKIQQL